MATLLCAKTMLYINGRYLLAQMSYPKQRCGRVLYTQIIYTIILCRMIIRSYLPRVSASPSTGFSSTQHPQYINSMCCIKSPERVAHVRVTLTNLPGTDSSRLSPYTVRISSSCAGCWDQVAVASQSTMLPLGHPCRINT